jgi:glycopeptide antibiotics resistance protein
VFFSLFFGIGIEVLQSRLTTTRNGDFFDVLANFTGALLALVFVVVAKQIRKKHT